MYSNKKIALHNATKTIIGKLDHSMQLHPKLAHKTTKKKRSNRRKKSKIAPNEGQICCCLRRHFNFCKHEIQSSSTSEGNFYSMNNCHQNINEPNLSNYKGVQMALSKKCIVKVDEYRTSKVCSSCGNELQNCYEPAGSMVCYHRKRRRRLKNEKRSRQVCLGTDKKIMCKSSECVERRVPGIFKGI
ncbi:uncharacterized protein RHIMIDRAFT_281346 [Rhizopus microsporus ATCC 52813]|uniref:Transposase n=1 Tax=Rhizopus microsporus ATCC 52813 TaxID=1340429 RepID=A0A2G4SWH2_RHIZD|nr:uncharacterized protein RHIMIDRAFT_281346 [Rhizopus microsporus ATCC 52813]PHZ13094.1 hypothetical protein RHIMIDRAFT_281346 [Rhizopus microsporus ATCC 52813]